MRWEEWSSRWSEKPVVVALVPGVGVEEVVSSAGRPPEPAGHPVRRRRRRPGFGWHRRRGRRGRVEQQQPVRVVAVAVAGEQHVGAGPLLVAAAHLEEERELLVLLPDDGPQRPPPAAAAPLRHGHPVHRSIRPRASLRRPRHWLAGRPARSSAPRKRGFSGGSGWIACARP